MIAETAKLITQLDLQDGLTGGLDRATGAVNRFSGNANRNFDKVKTGAVQMGQGMARVGAIAGGVVVAGLAGAAKAAINFEDAFAGVRKTMDERDLLKAGLSFDKLALRFREMALEIPISAAEFARLGEAAGALGVKAKDIEEFTKITALLGVTTDLTSDAAATALGQIGTILRFTGKDYQQFADSLVALGNAGASTESQIIEISKRFAAEASAAGLAKSAIAGLASATASLGFNPERGGTALARVFANMSTNISVANAKGEEFSRVTGRSIKELQRDLNQGRGMQIFLDVLEKIRTMKPTEAAKTLLALGVTNASDRNVFRMMSENLPFINEQLEIAKNSTGALSEESTKRFDTVRSKFQLLKNAIVEAGITVGEGFAPALGNAATKLSTFIKDNRGELKQLGKDIGTAIDGIDWGKVFAGVKTMVGLFKTGFEVVQKIPPEILAIGAGLVGLNKLSGGLFGKGIENIIGGAVGGIGRGITNKIPGLGRLTAQPVIVTNWPAGGLLGGAAGAAGGGGIMGRLANGIKIAGAVTLAAGSIYELGQEFGRFQKTVESAQQDLGDKAEAARDQTADQALANLRSMNRKLNDIQGLDRILADTFGGKEQADALQNLSHAIANNGKLNAAQVVEAIGVLKEAQRQALARGNQKVADAIGEDIKRLQSAQTRTGNKTAERVDKLSRDVRGGDARQTSLLRQINAKDTSVKVTTTVNTGVTIRDMQATNHTSTRYGFQAI